MAKKEKKNENAYKDFLKCKKEYDAAVKIDSGIFPEGGSVQFLNSLNGLRSKIVEASGDEAIATQIQDPRERNAQLSAGLLNVIESNLKNQLINNLESIIEDIPEEKFGKDPNVILTYELPEGSKYEKQREAHQRILNLQDSLKNPEKELDKIRKEMKEKYIKNIKEKYKNADKEAIELFANFCVIGVNEKYILRALNQARNDFLEAFSSENKRKTYVRAAHKATVMKYIKEGRIDEAIKIVEDPQIIYKEAKKRESLKGLYE